MKRWKRTGAILVAGLLISSTAFSGVCSVNVNVFAAKQDVVEISDVANVSVSKTNTKPKYAADATSYIITAGNKNAIRRLTEQYSELPDESVGKINGELMEQGVVTLDLSEKEAQKIEKDEQVLSIEENIMLEGSIYSANGMKISKDRKKTNTKKHRSHQKKKNKTKPTYISSGENHSWNREIIHATDVDEGEKASGTKIKVAILDSGIDYLDNIQVAEQRNFLPEQDDFTTMFMDETGHGTAVAGIIAGQTRPGETAAGINPDVEIYSAKVLDENNQAPLSRIIEGIYWAIEKDVQIINMSFGTLQYSPALENAIRQAADKGILIIAAAGNGGEKDGDTVEYPAAFPEVLAVGSVNAQGTVSEFSAQGESVELVAPGEAVRVTGAFGEDMVASGTSMAAPHVTAVASLLWAKNPDKSAGFIRTLLDESARSLGDADKSGYGLVDYEYAESIYQALELQKKADDEITVPDNNAKIQIYDNSDDEEKLEENRGSEAKGSWHWSEHKKYLDDKNINLPAMKQGAVYPDKEESGVKDMFDHPDFHGYFQTLNEENVNYIASYHYMIKIAEAYGKGNDYTSASKCKGLSNTSYNAIRRGFKGMNKKIKSFSANKDRKAFVYGIAMHTATDVFSHSTLKFYHDWTRITHKKPAAEADDPSFEPRRFTMAYRVQRNNIYRFQGKRNDVPVMHDFHAAGDTDGTYYYQGPQGPYYRAIRLDINADLAGVTNNTVCMHFAMISRNYSEKPPKR